MCTTRKALWPGLSPDSPLASHRRRVVTPCGQLHERHAHLRSRRSRRRRVLLVRELRLPRAPAIRHLPPRRVLRQIPKESRSQQQGLLKESAARSRGS